MKPEQITAWALDEASAEERQQLEAALLENPQDKVKADETKAFCDFLLSELRDDSLALTDKQRERLVEQSSRLPAASGTPAQPSEAGASETLALPPGARASAASGNSGRTTRWNIGVIVRLSLAACAVLGGFWTWQAYSSRQSEGHAVAAVPEKPVVKVQLAPKPEAKKKAGQGPEARLLAATPVKPVIVAEQPVVKTLPPAARADAGALALKPTNPAEAEKWRLLQQEHAAVYKKVQTEAQRLQKLAQDPSISADLRKKYTAELNETVKTARALMPENLEMSEGGWPTPFSLSLKQYQRVMTPGDVERLKRVQDENAYGLNFGGGLKTPETVGLVVAGTSMTTPKVQPAAAGAALGLANGSAQLAGGSSTMPVDAGRLTVNGGAAFTVGGTVSDATGSVLKIIPEAKDLLKQTQERNAASLSLKAGCRAYFPTELVCITTSSLSYANLGSSYNTISSASWATLKHGDSFGSLGFASGLLPEVQQVAYASGYPWMSTAPLELISAEDEAELNASLADYQSSLSFGDIGLHNRGSASVVLRAASASTGSIMVQSGAPLMIQAILQQGGSPFLAASRLIPNGDKYFKGIGFPRYEWFQLHPDVNANSPGVISFATAARSHLIDRPSVGDFSAARADASGVSDLQAAVFNVAAGPRTQSATPLISASGAAAFRPVRDELGASRADVLLVSGGVLMTDVAGNASSKNLPLDLMGAPVVTTKSGTRATMDVTREFIYTGAIELPRRSSLQFGGSSAAALADASDLRYTRLNKDGALTANGNVAAASPPAGTGTSVLTGEVQMISGQPYAVVAPAKPQALTLTGGTTVSTRAEPTMAFRHAAIREYMGANRFVVGDTTVAASNDAVGGTNSLGNVVAATPLSASPDTTLALGSASYSGYTTSSSGAMTVNGTMGQAPAQANTLAFANSAPSVPREGETIGSTVSGSGAMTKAGTGALVLAGGANTYTGATVVNGGNLQVSNGTAMQIGDSFAPTGEIFAGAKTQMKRSAGATLVLNGGVIVTQTPAAPAASPVAVVGGWATTDGKEVATFNSTSAMVQNPQAGAADANASPTTAAAPQAGGGRVQSGMLGGSVAEVNDYNTAVTQYQTVLRTDPSNVAARRGMEAAERKKQEYFKAAYDNEKAKLLADAPVTYDEAKVPVQVQSGNAVLGKAAKTDDFYFGKNVMPEEPKPTLQSQPSSGESYTRIIENELKDVAREPLSTLSIDVDTASYANVRRFLNQNMIPPPDAVRIEELVNYFPTAEEGPAHDAKEPFGVRVELAPCPWQPVHRLARISIKGREMDKDRKASNLVFLVDVSGSMNEPAKLPLVQQSLRMLTEQLGEGDRVTMVVYAGSSGVVLPPTSGEKKEEILGAINRLSAGGSTHGSAGIKLAYEQAVAGFIKGGVNRVILCTDGDFNVGTSSPEELEKLIKHKAKTGVFLSVLGFGSGNLKDRTMETLADKGNGNYAYIDSLSEARKVLVEQMSGTLVTIAKDVKIQVEFNPAAVRSYRLIGYENRLLAKEDFNDDTKDAGEIGAGHSVVALYEIVPANLPAGAEGAEGRPAVDSLKYQAPAISPAQLAETAKSGEMMTVKLRYKEPESDLSKLIEVPTKDDGKTLTASSEEYKFSAAVAGFGLLLRDSSYKGTLSWETVRRLALDGKGADKQGYRGEFLQLIDKARGLKETR